MSNEDWRSAVVTNLVQYMKGAGITRFDQESAKVILERLAISDRKLHKDDRAGYAYVLDQYSETGMSRFMKMCESEWSKPVEQLQSEPSEESAHQLECVIAVKLDKDTYNPSDIHRILQTYLIDALTEPFACAVVQVVKVHACWYDIKIRYSVNLCKIYELLLAPAWVVDAKTKPSSEFSKLTLACV